MYPVDDRRLLEADVQGSTQEGRHTRLVTQIMKIKNVHIIKTM